MSNANPLEDLVARMTVSELAQRSGRSVTDIAVFALGGQPRAKASAASPAAPSRAGTNGAPARRPGRAKNVDTRSTQGRTQYEQDVLGVLARANGKTNAQAIRSVVGGTPALARAALNRLIDNGQVQYEGKARATVYWAR